MDAFPLHLQSLAHPNRLTPSEINADGTNSLSQWLRANGSNTVKSPSTATLVPSLWALDHVFAIDNSTLEEEHRLSKIFGDADMAAFLDNIQALVTPSKSDDRLSEELLELLGYERVEVISEIVQNRDKVVEMGHGQSINVLSSVHAKKRLEAQLKSNAERPLFTGAAPELPEVLPHIYTSSSFVQNNVLSHLGSKYVLPIGTERILKEEYEEVVIPPAKPVPMDAKEKLLRIEELDPLVQGCFSAYRTLNRIQSIIHGCAYTSNENMLVCAPTGAGKTDVAMLTVLRVVSQHLYSPVESNSTSPSKLVKHSDFKIIYVAPMKALASEIVRKFSKRLAWLSIKVRELTGDMQLTKAEIAETQMIVTTPEKWDVVTRKPTGEGEIASKVRLLIIDEVHLLNEDRGAVIETVVARTLRQVEATQSIIRIVGLSATLPNYTDVADFLRVSRHLGLFYFDSSFRPVPLEQHFLGIKGKPNSLEARGNLDHATFDKVIELVQAGHQVMVFVHARKDTVKTAQALKEAAMLNGALDEFSCATDPKWEFYRREIGKSRNKEMKELYEFGFGIHHAGMLRADRNMMERFFLDRTVKVLCCTATLAWGVNLPAHAVLIKGTQIYDSARGTFVDLSVLDVLQIFGRAGRPGLENDGEGYILTSQEKLSHYLDAVTAQHPIESRFVTGLIDAMNAEIALGTVSTVSEAVRWIGYTYLFVRMKRNPFAYGMGHSEPAEDPGLSSKRRELVMMAARTLVEAQMIAFDEVAETFTITERGRIASKFYIRYQTVEIFNKEMKPVMTEADVLGMIASSSEFDQIQLRDAEIPELEGFVEDIIPCEVKGGVESKQGKVNILLQTYISRAYVNDFALVSDSNYVAQNGARIIRAALEIAISRKWAGVTAVLMGICKAVEMRMWPFENPMRQFRLSPDLLHGLEVWADDYTPVELASKSAAELARLVHSSERHGQALLRAAKQFPSAEVQYTLKPLSSDLLRIDVEVLKDFEWEAQLHGFFEPFWLWVEDAEGTDILQLEHLSLRKDTQRLSLQFHIAYSVGSPANVLRLRFISDRWLGAEEEIEIPLGHLKMPSLPLFKSHLVDLPFLSLSCIDEPLRRNLIEQYHVFNAIQTQSFWQADRLPGCALLSAPAGCGKSTIGYIAIIQQLLRSPKRGWAICTNSSSTGASQAASSLRNLCKGSGISVALFRPNSHAMSIRENMILVTSSTSLLSLAEAPWLSQALPELQLVMFDSLQLLSSDYELAISLLLRAIRFLFPKVLGFTSSLNDVADLSTWLHVGMDQTLAFQPNDRDYALSTVVKTFTIPYSTALFKAMVRPLFSTIKSSSSDDQTLVFLPSRTLCHGVANDLLTLSTLEDDTRAFLGRDVELSSLRSRLELLKDSSLSDTISNGVGVYHRGMDRYDASLCLKLYAEGIIRVLLVSHDSCWEVPVRGNTVVLGTEYVASSGVSSGSRSLKQYDITELLQMQGRVVRHGQAGTFTLFCQPERRSAIVKLLSDGLPLESSLLTSNKLKGWLQNARDVGTIRNKQDALDFVSSTYLGYRLVSNPAYYGFPTITRDEILSRAVDALWVEGI